MLKHSLSIIGYVLLILLAAGFVVLLIQSAQTGTFAR